MTITHPWARYRQAKGLTQSYVADKVGITRHMVIRLEQSLFWHPPDNLLVKMGALYEIELGIFEESYYTYVRERRELFRKEHQSFASVLGLVKPEDKIYSGRKHPLVFYRETYGLSRMGFCKGLCLHYDPITEYEQNKQRNIPDQLVEACEEISWSSEAIVDTVALWRINGYAATI